MRIILAILFTSCMSSSISFIEKIIHDFDTNSYFIVFQVETDHYNGLVTVPNEGLYYYYHQTNGFTKEEYIEYIRNEFIKKVPVIKSDTLNLHKWDFEKVGKVETIKQNEGIGVDSFISTYFEGRVLKDNISDEERTAIISQLFEWEIASKIDDETGYLVIKR